MARYTAADRADDAWSSKSDHLTGCDSYVIPSTDPQLPGYQCRTIYQDATHSALFVGRDGRRVRLKLDVPLCQMTDLPLGDDGHCDDCRDPVLAVAA